MIRAGLYGANGHQIQHELAKHPLARVTAVAAVPEDFPAGDARRYATLDELLADPEVDFVSLCSPRRRDQAAEAVRCLSAGKHVLAEKPCAMTEPELDAIITAARATGKVFHEMAGTAFTQPYLAMREVVLSGRLGEIVQVVTEKSYPYHEGRPQDEGEDLDGGQIGQNAIHALRFIEHVAGVPITSVRAAETRLGNPVPGGGLRMAASLLLTLANGGLASVSANYLNPRGTGTWGDESLRILGTRGMVESRAGGRHTRLVIGERDEGPLDTAPPALSWLDLFLTELGGGPALPLTLEEELSPTRWTIRARESL
jgi:predicted dehydrogenase